MTIISSQNRHYERFRKQPHHKHHHVYQHQYRKINITSQSPTSSCNHNHHLSVVTFGSSMEGGRPPCYGGTNESLVDIFVRHVTSPETISYGESTTSQTDPNAIIALKQMFKDLKHIQDNLSFRKKQIIDVFRNVIDKQQTDNVFKRKFTAKEADEMSIVLTNRLQTMRKHLQDASRRAQPARWVKKVWSDDAAEDDDAEERLGEDVEDALAEAVFSEQSDTEAPKATASEPKDTGGGKGTASKDVSPDAEKDLWIVGFNRDTRLAWRLAYDPKRGPQQNFDYTDKIIVDVPDTNKGETDECSL